MIEFYKEALISEYSHKKGKYTTEDKVVSCLPIEATCIEINVLESEITPIIGNPKARQITTMRLKVGDDFREFLSSLKTKEHQITYTEIYDFGVAQGFDFIPEIILRAMKAIAVYNVETYGFSPYIMRLKHNEISKLDVTPLYA